MSSSISTQLDSSKFQNFDYFSKQLRDKGIYYGWSHIYGHKPKPADKDKLLAYEEVENAGNGHLKGTTHQLGEVSIQVKTPFAIVLVSSLEKNQAITTANHLLVTTVARAKNTGMAYNEDGTRLLKIGETPFLLEAVQTSLSIWRKGTPTVYVLDHIGKRTE